MLLALLLSVQAACNKTQLLIMMAPAGVIIQQARLPDLSREQIVVKKKQFKK